MLGWVKVLETTPKGCLLTATCVMAAIFIKINEILKKSKELSYSIIYCATVKRLNSDPY